MKILRFLAVFALVFQLASPASALTGNRGEPAHYVALGDSLAFGIVGDGLFGKSYTDFLAEALAEEDLLASFNKGFAFPGYKTTDILRELEENTVKPSSATDEEVALLDEIKKADVITLSIGANDVLAGIKPNEAGELSFDLVKVLTASKTMAQNLDTILKEITAINPKADVFVMGYYNPFPYITEQTAQLEQLVTMLNKTVEAVVVANKMGFVDISEEMASDFEAYLPNPKNIHPGEVGYKAIADVFEPLVKEYIMLIPLPEVIPDPEPTFKDVEGWAVEYVELAATYGHVKGYEDGTFRPNNTLTRAQMTSILARALELPVSDVLAPFTDIAGYGGQTQQEIAAAYEAGIIQGNGTAFNPSDKLTRMQAARMFYRAYTYEMGENYVPKEIAPFTDIANYSAEDQRAISMLYELGIAVGDQGQYKPANSITRAHAAKMIVNFSNVMIVTVYAD